MKSEPYDHLQVTDLRTARGLKKVWLTIPFTGVKLGIAIPAYSIRFK